jgi:DNA-binding response OmpR family regulator
MLTAKVEEADQLVGLTVGADDYIPKSFFIKVPTAPRRASVSVAFAGVAKTVRP